jgi:hypothetical protein
MVRVDNDRVDAHLEEYHSLVLWAGAEAGRTES